MVTWLLILICAALILMFALPPIVTGIILALNAFDSKREAKKWRR